MQSLPDVMNILYLLFLILIIFAVIGVALFSSTLPDYFSSVPVCILYTIYIYFFIHFLYLLYLRVPLIVFLAMYTLFIFLSQDGWGDILNAFLVCPLLCLSPFSPPYSLSPPPLPFAPSSPSPPLSSFSLVDRQETSSHLIPAIYMVLFITIGPFILSNAFIGVIVNNLQNVC